MRENSAKSDITADVFEGSVAKFEIKRALSELQIS